MKIKDIKVKHVLLVTYGGWCGLGFWRGINSYKHYDNFNYKIEHKIEYKKIENEKKNNLIYTNIFLHGAAGTIFYAFPFSFPFFLYKEIYRLEVNTRNLENEKKSRFYKELI